MKRNILISLILGTLLSCTKTIDFNDGGSADQVIVSSFFSPGNNFSLYLTKSNSILESRETNPPLEGTVDLYEDGTLIKHFDSQVGTFTADDIKPAAGKSYKVVVVSNGKTVEAETNIPDKAEVISADTTTVRDEHGLKSLKYKIIIKDPAGDDYYRIIPMYESLSFYTYTDSTGNLKRRYSLSRYQVGIQSDDPVFKGLYNNFGSDVVDFGPSNDYSIFQDNYFQGKEYLLQFLGSGFYNSNYNSPSGYGYGDPSNPNLTTGVIYERNTIHVQKLSKDFFNYLKYLNLYNFYHDDPFSEPVPVYSNVKNGVGIFAGFNDDTKITFENIYIPFSMDTIKVEDGYYGGYQY